MPFVNQDGLTGLIVTPGSVEELKNAILKLKENPNLTRQLGESARQRVEREFTAQCMINQIRAVYQDIVS